MKKNEKKAKVVIMDPVRVHRESMAHVLREFLSDRVYITDVVSSLSEVMYSTMLRGPADIYLMEAFGQSENYKNWCDFTHFMATHYPSSTCLVWSSKPTMFLKKHNALNGNKACWQIPKKIKIRSFVHFLKQILDKNIIATPLSYSCIGPPISSLTLTEITIITYIIDGCSIKKIAKKHDVAYKTISTHKRNAMIKMRISTTAQLRSLFMDGYIIRGDHSRNLPIEINVNQPIRL
ncbi:helix-turn-helix transcriptional regulator [Serratia nevei]|uniref:helix-turn-helix transcriptional regulator n=1 Tax=Serratia nevei TaxID=2703794 RepID=UPI003FA775B3